MGYIAKVVDYMRQRSEYLLLFSCIVYVPLSWVLLFRDQRAIEGISYFYPALETQLIALRAFLLAHNLNTVPTLLFAGFAIISFFSYFLSLKREFSYRRIQVFAVLFMLVTYFSYPVLSTDIFSYIFSDRVATVYHQNVWKVAPIQFAHGDPFSQFADWQTETRVYGGVNQFIYSFASVLGGNDLLKTVLLYKFIPLLTSLASMQVLFLTLKKYFPSRTRLGLLLVFWNPLFILETIGSGHNDILMLFFLLLGIYYMLGKKWMLVGIALAASVQVKIISLFFVCFLGIHLLRNKAYRPLLKLLGTFTLVNVSIFYLMDVNPFDFAMRVLFNTTVYWQSLPFILNETYPQAKFITTVASILTMGGLILYQVKNNSNPLYMFCLWLLLYLLFFTSLYWSWYILWVLPFVIFLDSERLMKVTLSFTVASLLLYPVYWIALRFNYQHGIWPFVLYSVLLLFPVLTFFRYEKTPPLLPQHRILPRKT